MELESDGDTNHDGCTWYSHQRVGTETGVVGKKRTSGHHPNSSVIKKLWNMQVTIIPIVIGAFGTVTKG